MIIIKNIKQLTTKMDKAPILKNKTAWMAINPAKNKEKTFRLLESCIVDLVYFYCIVKIDKNNKYCKPLDMANYIET